MNTAGQFEGDDVELETADHPSLSLAGEIVEVRRAAGVSAVVGALASAVAIAWFGRAISTGSVLDWTLALVMGGLGVAWLAAFVDARTPLLVADDQGVRLRLGRAWVGLPWTAVARVEHRPRRGLLRDGLLNVVPHNPDRLVSELTPASARRASLARRLHGGPFAMPLGLGTRVVGAGDDLTLGLDRLASREAEVQVLEPVSSARTVPAPAEERATVEVERRDETDEQVTIHPARDTSPEVDTDLPTDAPIGVAAPAPGRTRALLSRAYSGVTARLRPTGEVDDRREVQELDQQELDGLEESGHVVLDDETEVASETPAPVRVISTPTRSEMVSAPTGVDEETQTFDRQSAEFFEEDQAWGERVSPIARAAHPVAPLVVDDFGLEPAADPVIGPDLRAARTRIGLSTDQLAERTRIRPHVIEAIEVDDFVPCGGDFYARGHLRTLARVLGIDVAPLLVTYDERYANAPIDPRRVFEAELATGAHGSIRGTRGGPNWSILVAAVMAVVLCWSVAQLVMDTPAEVRSTPVLNGSGGPGGAGTVDPVQVKVVAPTSGARVMIRDSAGEVVFRGNLAIGETQSVKATPPVRVQSSDGSVTVTVAGARRGAIGQPGEPGQGTYAD